MFALLLAVTIVLLILYYCVRYFAGRNLKVLAWVVGTLFFILGGISAEGVTRETGLTTFSNSIVTEYENESYENVTINGHETITTENTGGNLYLLSLFWLLGVYIVLTANLKGKKNNEVDDELDPDGMGLKDF